MSKDKPKYRLNASNILQIIDALDNTIALHNEYEYKHWLKYRLDAYTSLRDFFYEMLRNIKIDLE